MHEIEVRSQNALEWQDWTNRVINWQRSGIPAATDQRALRIIRNDSLVDLQGNPLLGIARPSGAPNQSPNETLMIEINVSAHPAGMPGRAAGADGLLCTTDDVPVALTAAQALDALRETVAHECGHGCHLEHNFCEGDRHRIAWNQGEPDTVAVHTGADGICDTTAAPADVQLIPVGQRLADSVVIEGGLDGIDTQTAVIPDDGIVGNQVLSGPDGIAQTTAVGNDDQALQPGEWVVNAPCVRTGEDGISQTVAMTPADVQQIPVGNGEPHTIGILPGPDGQLQAVPEPDDDYGPGNTITTGADGVLQTFARISNQGVSSVMTSDVLVPVPNTYTQEDLNQVRTHLKHP